MVRPGRGLAGVALADPLHRLVPGGVLERLLLRVAVRQRVDDLGRPPVAAGQVEVGGVEITVGPVRARLA
jgi:hypothetical protein